jgi:DNA-binding Xre family transcriptional regulator
MINQGPDVVDNVPEARPSGQSSPPQPSDLLEDPQFRERFEQTSAALEAADLVRLMRQNALSRSGVRGISQDELAARTGLSQPRISQIERGTGRDGISYAVLRKIAYACGIEWGDLLRDVLKRGSAVTGAGASAAATSALPAARGVSYKGHTVQDLQGAFVGTISAVLFDESGQPDAVRVGGGIAQILNVKDLHYVAGNPPVFIADRSVTVEGGAVDVMASGLLFPDVTGLGAALPRVRTASRKTHPPQPATETKEG